MSDVLSQAEIEALLNSLSAGEGGTESPSTTSTSSGSTIPAKTSAIAPIAYEVYDFRRPDKFSKEQLRTLQMLHETFAPLAGSALSATLRCPVSIDLISLEQVPYEEYLRGINHSVFTITSLPPLTGQAIMEVEFSLFFAMIDRLLGGPGRSISRTSLTDIERPLVKQIVERMFIALKTAWEGVVIVNPGIEGMETSAQFVQIAPPNDIVVTILFEVKIGSTRGAMSLCIPYLVLKPITTKLSAQKWFVSASRKHSPVSRRQLTQHLRQSNVECSLELGKAKLSVRDFLSLRKDDILKLDQRTAYDLKFYVSGQPKLEGKPALNGKKLVFTVSGLIEE